MPTLHTEIEDGFDITGLDAESLLLQFSEAYHVDITTFDFTGFISPDDPDLVDTIWFFPLVAYFLIGWLLKTLLGLLSWPFDSQLAQRLWQRPVSLFWQPTESQPKPLVIGDFVASAAVGQFVRREQVYFRLVR